MAEQTLNIPQILVFIVVTVLAVRWFFSKSSTDSNSSNSSTRPTRTSPRINAAQIEQIAQMFPQLERRSIAWELFRNGGNVQAVTEKVLSGRGLETPPPTFTVPTPAPRSAPTPSSHTSTPKPATKPDLIARYNLSSKISSQNQQNEDGEQKPTKQKVWSQDRNERQTILQRRREEMILAARRKMEEKDREAKA
ncbi:hypothetical protein DM02DRAFT_514783 [Periconia macrospinosa]|uniref:Coupling of ubiquitin conjugation to ER degradation protein 1 n=1 Tax=Periconia macrospinosa TaxID=97972 RepID=A0A2V1E6N4_9PLEO|nr:hypothetical protein DM02DRAFT_514783 [Periconia macrospinosa]